MAHKQDLKSVSHDDLVALVRELGQPMFRVKQIEQWLYQKHVTSFEEMTNLPRALRESLDERFCIGFPKMAARQVSRDGTRKYLLEFEDGCNVEAVGIPSSDHRLTVCFSTQAGCAMKCAFCATGHGGFTRNLTSSEMFDQVALVGADFGQRVTNVVAMGQGEPFNNYDSTLGALRLMNSADFLNIGARHITLSTCGIIPGIHRFSEEPEQFTLAISLHSAIQRTRDELMPGVSRYTLDLLRDAIKSYGDRTKRRPSLEYALIKDVNDDDAHLDALVSFCTGMLCHVNLIPLNPIAPGESSPYLFQPSQNMGLFEHSLSQNGIEVSIRSSRGSDIDGACGQLRQKLLSRSGSQR